MGSGKGSPEYWVAVVKPDRIMFEMAGVTEEVAREAFRLASAKLPVKSKFVKKENAPGAIAAARDEAANQAAHALATIKEEGGQE